MKTVTIQIGNSDDKLTQSEWRDFCGEVHDECNRFGEQIHFSAPSVGWAKWQNAVWVIEIMDEWRPSLAKSITKIRKKFKQTFVAWTEGDTEFL